MSVSTQATAVVYIGGRPYEIIGGVLEPLK